MEFPTPLETLGIAAGAALGYQFFCDIQAASVENNQDKPDSVIITSKIDGGLNRSSETHVSERNARYVPNEEKETGVQQLTGKSMEDSLPFSCSIKSVYAVTMDEVFDVVVIGTGASASLAALSAKWAGSNRIVALEKDIYQQGGTTNKSGGIFWIPNNPIMKADGLIDKRDDAVRYMARLSFPDEFDAEAPRFGLTHIHYDRLVNYYDTGSAMVEELVRRQVTPDLSPFTTMDGELMYDYSYSESNEPDNHAPQGRGLGIGNPQWLRGLIRTIAGITDFLNPAVRTLSGSFPALKDFNILTTFGIDLGYGIGPDMVRCFNAAMEKEGIDIRKGHAVDGLLVNENEEVVGVQVQVFDPNEKVWQRKYFGAKQGVIFGTGGFSMDQDLVSKSLPGPVLQTAAAKPTTGDFHKLAEKLGCEFEMMDKIWGCESYAEEFDGENWETTTNILQQRGDSFFVVNGDGVRVYNEKGGYDKRVKIHWQQPEKNRFLFMIGDERCAEKNGSEFNKQWPADLNSSLYIKGENLQELRNNMIERLKGDKLGKYQFQLSSGFLKNLETTLKKFNSFAETGIDSDFGRGDIYSEKQWTYAPDNDKPNKCLYPLNEKGPFYCVIIAASILDTKGGAVVNVHQQPIRKDGTVVQGLYAVGNAASPISGDAYWSGGATLGSAMVSGYTAGVHASLYKRQVTAKL